MNCLQNKIVSVIRPLLVLGAVSSMSFAVAFFAGCQDKEVIDATPAPTQTTTASTSATATTPIRTMKSTSLHAGLSPNNMVMDPFFDANGQFGIGRWLALVDANGGDYATTSTTELSDSPMGPSLPIGVVSDPSGRALNILTQVVGGTGPFQVSLWVGQDGTPDSAGYLAPSEYVSVTLAGVTKDTPQTEDILLAADSTKVMGNRTWVRYTSMVSSSFTLGMFFQININGSDKQWYLQAPEIVPKALMTGTSSKSAFRSTARPLSVRELRAIERYKKEPLLFGLLRNSNVRSIGKNLPRKTFLSDRR